MKKFFLLPAFLVLAACVPADNTAMNTDDSVTIELPSDSGTEQMMIEDGDPSNDNDDMIDDTHTMDDGTTMEGDSHVDTAVYTAYTPDVIADGHTKVLFFHAPWCPVCRQADTQIQSIYSGSTPEFTMYKVDYDTETALKSRYGVTYQHTFVVVDGQGNAVQTLQGANEAQIRALIGA